MKTVTVQIGNSDNKLTQQDWSEFVGLTRDVLTNYADDIHFFGGSANYESWQNVAWVITLQEDNILVLKQILSKIGKKFKQDSVAWTEGETQFI